MNPDFYVALQVTWVGMLLVFGTLLICAGVITVLSRLFKAKPEEQEEESPAVEVFPEVADEVAPAAKVAAEEAAAIAVALAVASRATQAAVVRSVVVPFWSASRIGASVNEDIVGEVVTIIDTNPGPGTWSGAGRVQTAR